MVQSKYKLFTAAGTVLVLALSGCGGGTSPPTQTNSASTTATPNNSSLNSVAPPSTAIITSPPLPDSGVVHQVAKTPAEIASLQPCPVEPIVALEPTSSPPGGGIIDLKVASVFNAPGSANTLLTMLGTDGRVYTAGANGDLTNGLGPTAPIVIDVPTPLSIDRPIRKLMSASSAIDDQGQLWVWGTLPWDPRITSRLPTRLSTLSGLVKILVGGSSTGFLALRNDGTVYSIGYTSLQTSTSVDLSSAPYKLILPLTGIRDIQVIGGNSNLALDSTGKVFSWGFGATLGRITSTVSPPDVPAQILGLPPISKLFLNGYKLSAFAQTTTGEVWFWGYATYESQRFSTSAPIPPGQANDFGIDRIDSHILTPRLHPTLANLRIINQTRSYSTAIDLAGNAMAWGSSGGPGFFYYEPSELLKMGSGITKFPQFGAVEDFKIPEFDKVIWLKGGQLGAFDASGKNAEFADACAPKLPSAIKFKTLLSDVGETFTLTENGEVWVVEHKINRTREDGFVNFISARRRY